MDHLPARLTVLFAVYEIQSLVINNCSNSKLEIYEDAPAPVICGDINSNADVTWYLGNGSIGKCDSEGRCTVRSDYQLSRLRKSTESQLKIISIHRGQAGLTIACQEMRTFYKVSCTLVIKRHPVLTGCHVSLNNVTGVVSGSCLVQKAFSSDNNYSCTWTVNSSVITPLYGVEPFDNCSFTQPMQGTGLYNYTIVVNPPSTAGFSQSVVIVEPGNVTTSCPPMVDGGTNISCECQTTNTASPPATVRWEGRDSEKLVKTNVQREDNGTQFTCHVTWAGRVYTSINYTLLVAAGEVTEATVKSPSYLSTDGGIIFWTPEIQTNNGTQGDSSVFEEGEASSLLTSTTTIIIIGGAAAGGAVIVFWLLVIYFIRRKRQTHARRVSKSSSSTANTQQPEGQTRSEGGAQRNSDDFEDHINEVYESVDKRVQKISYNETRQGIKDDCPYYNDKNNVYDDNIYYNDQSSSLHQTHACPSGKTTHKVCEHRLSMDPWD